MAGEPRGTHGLSDEARDYWAGRIFDRVVATDDRRRFVQSLGHGPVDMTKRVGGELVTDAKEEAELTAEPEIARTTRVEWEGQLPRSAKTLEGQARKAGYLTRAYRHHDERRGAHGRLLEPHEADFCTLVAARGRERFLVMWAEVKGSWKLDTVLDYTPRDEGATPKIVKMTELKKERLQ